MFHSARIKLTAWYLVISMIVSLVFSAAIYSGVNEEFRRFERIHETLRERIESGQPIHIPRSIPRSMLDPEMITQARSRLQTSLGIINLTIWCAAGAAGYFLAGRTLRPIRNMVEEQQRFISDASHELRTPLTSLRSEIEVNLRNKKFSVNDARVLLASNLEEVIRLQTVSDHLLELTRYESASLRQHNETFSLKQSIGEAVQKIRPLAKLKEIELKAEIDDVSIRGIKERITELFVVLLDNGIKYSHQKGTVSITSKITDHHARITVTDRGIGIEEKDLPHIFERFYRADFARSRAKVSGYGLGLSIAKKIAELHNGSIAVKSSIGEETMFTVTLPTAPTSH